MNPTVPKGITDRLKEATTTEEVETLIQEAAEKRDASPHTRNKWVKTAQQVLKSISKRRIEKARR
jgi:deoxyribose-phosphate aldolase